MKSPWKVIAGLVSRGKPETPDELEYEILATPDPSAEQPNIDVVRLKIGASHPRFLHYPLKKFPSNCQPRRKAALVDQRR